MTAAALPDRIGRYRVESVLGRGAMGVVYRAHDPEIDRPVAIKLVAADLLDGEERQEFLDRFRREARAAGRCAHPNIVTVHDFALHDGLPFIAMEFVEGASLAQHLAQTPDVMRSQAAAIVLQVLDALAAAHALGIVHRDIKPANILITADGRVKVADFGIARLQRAELTGSNMIVGSLAYMSPEQCRGDAVDARSDLFSLGAVFYQILTGAKPFPGASDASVMQKLLFETPAALSAPAGLAYASVLSRALAKSADARFPDAASMADAIRAWHGDAADEGTVVMPVRTGGTMPPPAAAPADSGSLTLFGRKLAEHLGPIAAHLVQQEARRTSDASALRQALGARIPDPTAREKFLRDTGTMEMTRSGPASTLAPAMLQAAERGLAVHLGPIAAIMVRREAAKAESADAFWEALAARIDDPVQRARFLAGRPDGLEK